ncbi:chromobox protein homolog 3-like [Toxorhynchites rutilus septentrionalis]|uniref:chromobox protein homolog 3-like n=1 Tax=Toxorhynchites rutilus septentrionalis TaxID=329112 RepID=UPI00247A1E70|nr:chromobox protein homolog 3-like [Toxorhynchites rutilus septentrionalis]
MPKGDAKEYEVEQILDRRIRRGKVQFLIKWKGCNHSENTWEPEEHLNCLNLLERFRNECAEKSAKTRGQKRKSTFQANTDREKSNSAEKTKYTNNNRSKSKRTPIVLESKIVKSEILQQQYENRSHGFQKGYIAETIMGITEEDGERLFLIKWKDRDELEMVTAKVTREHVPELVIDFYEDRIIWNETRNCNMQLDIQFELNVNKKSSH